MRRDWLSERPSRPTDHTPIIFNWTTMKHAPSEEVGINMNKQFWKRCWIATGIIFLLALIDCAIQCGPVPCESGLNRVTQSIDCCMGLMLNSLWSEFQFHRKAKQPLLSIILALVSDSGFELMHKFFLSKRRLHRPPMS